MPLILIIDDDDLFRESLSHNLSDVGYDVIDLGDGALALEHLQATEHQPDLILLDWKMPQLNGIEVLKTLRQRQFDVPVIFLTVLGDQIYEEAALAGGAVDFIEKSRSFTIIQRRIELVLSDKSRRGDKEAETEEPSALKVGELELRIKSNRAYWRGEEVDLSISEFKMVHLMARQAGNDVTYRDLYDQVHGEGFQSGFGAEGYRGNVRTFIKRIREKFRDLDDDFDCIENYPGFGYRWSRAGGEPEPG
jgi:two-component system, OmpR family, response regulator ChvI